MESLLKPVQVDTTSTTVPVLKNTASASSTLYPTVQNAAMASRPTMEVALEIASSNPVEEKSTPKKDSPRENALTSPHCLTT
jgi:hypothetical protein